MYCSRSAREGIRHAKGFLKASSKPSVGVGELCCGQVKKPQGLLGEGRKTRLLKAGGQGASEQWRHPAQMFLAEEAQLQRLGIFKEGPGSREDGAGGWRSWKGRQGNGSQRPREPSRALGLHHR